MSNSPKILDIIPPEKINHEAEKKEVKNEEVSKIMERGKSSPFKKIFFSTLILIIAFASFANFFLNNVKIQIWPETETLDFTKEITVEANTKEIYVSSSTIPGEIFEEEKSVSREFPATGEVLVEKKAHGQIRVYNNYSVNSQPLVSETRFVSAEGKIFKTLERVVIPGGKMEKGNLQPGFIDVEVEADEPGESYNIGPTAFSIPGFLGGPKYTSFYAKSFQDMAGGFSGKVLQVSSKDLEYAKNTLIDSLIEESKNSLKEKISTDYILPENAVFFETLESNSSAKEGSQSPNFTYKVKIKIKELVFKKTDLETFAKEFILSQISKDKKIEEKSLNINWNAESADIPSGRIILAFEFSAKIYFAIPEAELKEALQGKSLAEARAILGDLPNVKKVQVIPWPFWLNSLPNDADKIKVELVLD
ncbi:MAG: hypothetical protein PHF44_03670 [Candidatus Pacebacteria bacterium]|nr:hypothetical protein [Candidatus Paceibacterota bacterium]